MTFEESFTLTGMMFDIIYSVSKTYWYISIPLSIIIFWWANSYIRSTNSVGG